MLNEKIEERDALFVARSAEIKQKLTKNMKISDRISNIRFFIFILTVISAVAAAYFALPPTAYLTSAVLFVGFLILVLYHTNIKRETAFLQMLEKIQSEYQARLLHQFSELSDDGQDFADLHHEFSGDLDLFGPQSLYHLLSTAQTWYGRKTFSSYLLEASRPDKTADEIRQRQEAVRENHKKLASLQKFEAIGRLSKKSAEDPRRLIAYIQNNDSVDSPVRLFWLILCALNSVSLIVFGLLAWVFFVVPPFIPLIFLILQLVLIALKYQKFKPIFVSVENFHEQLLSYVGLFSEIEESDVKASLLVEAKQVLFDTGSKRTSTASSCVRKLHATCLFIQARSQPLLFFILNVLFQYDVFCVFALETWKKQYGRRFEGYVKSLGNWEALMSLTTMTYVYPACNFPSFVKENDDQSKAAYFTAVDMGHPLIPIHKQVRNDFELPGGIALITGSNMSGKTTLLRTVGINAVLAYAGTYCCVESLEIGLMQIGSSMRIADDLSEGVSTFYAELLRIEKIVKKSREEQPLLFLIDEIFRGTNSRDRTDGARIVLRNLSKPWIIGLMSTHDYELCSKESQEGFSLLNYHFSEHYDEEGIHFDYKLSDGVSTSTNARFLMKLIGIE